MSEASPRREAVVLGLFISIAVVILVVTLLTIGSIREGFGRTIRVTAVFPEVSGLSTGNSVWFAGVPVGSVRRIELDGGTRVTVEMSISEASSRSIPSDALASIATDGLIGSKIVVLYEGTEQAGPLVSGDRLQAGASVSPEQIMASLQRNNENLLQITTALSRGEGSLGRLLQDEDLYAEVTSAVGELCQASANARQLTAELREGQLSGSLLASVASIEEATSDAAALVDGLGRRDTPVGVLLNDPRTGDELQETLGNLNESSVLLAENLEAMQSNFLLRGFFRRQEREQEAAPLDWSELLERHARQPSP